MTAAAVCARSHALSRIAHIASISHPSPPLSNPKALGYSLNGPSREMLYVRTSEDIKFKAKSWIDMFGTRGAKATGSIVNNTFRHSLDILLTQGSLVSSFFVAVWITAALRLSRLYRVRKWGGLLLSASPSQ